MLKQMGVAFGAGLASALLFVVSARGTPAASLIAYFTTLPLMIAGLGFGTRAGFVGTLVGFAAVTLSMGPVLGAFYALCFAAPGCWLSHLALLAQPAPSGAVAQPVPAGGLMWYPIDRLVTWAAAAASGAVLIIGGAAIIRFGGFGPASAAVARRVGEVLDMASTTPSESADVAALFVRVLPIAMAGSLFLMLIVNLWLGARIAQFSQRLMRPWPNVPDGLRLPNAAAGLFILSLIPSFASGPIATAAGTIAAAMGMAFALQGIGTAHVLTRGFAARRAVLALIYIVTFVVPVAIVALALIGVVDCLFSFRNRRPPTIKPMHPTGG